MSNETTPSTSKFSLVREILAFLKLGDDGKLDSFFGRVTKNLNKEVSALRKNLENLKFNHDQKVDDLKDKLEDAETALNESYRKVTIDKIGNNADQAAFQETYLESIDDHEIAYKKIEKFIEAEKEAYTKAKEEINERIESLQKRINKISAE